MEIRATKTISRNANLVFPLFDTKDLKSDPLFKSLEKEDQRYIERVITTDLLNKKKSKSINPPSNPKRTLVFIGLGTRKDYSKRNFFVSGRRIVVELKAAGVESAIVSLDNLSQRGMEDHEFTSLLTQNLIMANYSFLTHKEKPKDGWPTVKKIELYSKTPEKITKYISEGKIIGDAVNTCRDLANTPGGIMTPEKLANAAKKIGNASRVRVKVLEESAIRKLGMGGVLGVGSGSAEKPKFIILEYGDVKKKKPLVFVGKGITFDTGGLNIKSDESMLTMHMDMSGGAAVINAVSAIAKLKLKIPVVGIIPAVENMPSGSSYRPGDLLKTITGKTIEVLNTDAEGRVILADGLGYAKRYKPSLIVDVATLTGAAVVALGQRANGLFSNKNNLLSLGEKIGERTGDYAWPLPLWDEYDEEIKGTFGDVANIGRNRYGGAITAAAFLKQFVGEYPWIHLDIAPMMTSIEGQYLEKGATGTGVRFLVEIAKEYKN